ncbi:unnamed protein product [Didymodactylos carnosus]|uniref:Fibronectin type-III domain-containing protein n=1 Tax=Didymodactylos carnosus TaxID=1234261 RepID=A0A814VHN2_9BILA|nr:unnamed protein product [Didymodactylos carnosus]CAF3953356.1 unnamed protein product [Didymodactylos carnosus]
MSTTILRILFDYYVGNPGNILGNFSTISSSGVRFNVTASDCAEDCRCLVTRDDLMDWNLINLTLIETTSSGAIEYHNLAGYTNYTFTANCSQGSSSDIRSISIKTLVGVPSEPQNIQFKSENGILLFTWEKPATPNGPIDHYYVTVNNEKHKILSDAPLSYEISPIVPNKKYTFLLEACNIEDGNKTVCSNSVSQIYEEIVDIFTTKLPNSANYYTNIDVLLLLILTLSSYVTF